MTTVDRDQRVATLRREAAAIAHAAHQGTAAEVPNCPGWTVADLLAHLTNLYRGVAELVRTTAEEGRDHWPPKQFIDLLSLVVVAALRRGEPAAARTHRIRINGRLVEVAGRDFAAAVATAIREEERQGTAVRRVERA